MVQFNVHDPVQGTRSSSRYTVQFKVHCSVQGTKVHGPVQGTKVQFKVHGPVQGARSSSRYTFQFQVHGPVHGRAPRVPWCLAFTREPGCSPERQGVCQTATVFVRQSVIPTEYCLAGIPPYNHIQ